MSACSEVDLGVRLYELGVLPEECRKAFVEKVIEYAMVGDDLYAIESPRIQSVFTKAELDQFRKRVRKEFPNLFNVSWHWKHDFLTSATPEEHMAPLLESYEALKKEFEDDPNLVRMIESEIESLNAWVAEEMADYEEPRKREPRRFGEVDSADAPPAGSRSIFDDIDE